MYLVQELRLCCHLSCQDLLLAGQQPHPVSHLRGCLARPGDQGHKAVALVAYLSQQHPNHRLV